MFQGQTRRQSPPPLRLWPWQRFALSECSPVLIVIAHIFGNIDQVVASLSLCISLPRDEIVRSESLSNRWLDTSLWHFKYPTWPYAFSPY